MQNFSKAIAAMMLTVAVCFAAGCRKPDEPNNGGNNNGGNVSNNLNGHDYVDLGLPSGTLWAICNVGATTPEDYGDYYAWGETEPKTTYNWNTYKYANGDYAQLTKYCNKISCGYNGFTDNLTILLSEDNAATANWGVGWRIPTKDEWQELYNNTTVTWTMQNEVNGLLFTARNGRSLFLPAAGCHLGEEISEASDYGEYWSSLLYTDWPEYAWCFCFDSGDTGMDYYVRYCGRTVRPVCSMAKN